MLFGSLLAGSSSVAGSQDLEAFFEVKIRPVLVAVCLRCHGESKSSAGLRIDSREALVLGGESGAAIVPGRPDESLLMRAISRHESVSAMPPEKEQALRPEQVAHFSEWIQTGAVWPAKTATFATDKHWAFEPISRAALPNVRDVSWVSNELDCFIRSKQEALDLIPAPQADKRRLIRRITFDLTGLPPSPDEIQEFLDDASPAAYVKLVDRLLSSPNYGQRWGRHWLDVVRYADARDLIQLPIESDFREAWRYRDWVVSAWNRDLPYDEFITQQLAGDLQQPADPSEIDADALVATGMLAIADFVPGDVDKQQMIADYVNDEIDVVGRAFLGLTLACARCHDHKFDPVSIEDYYALAGIFFSTRVIPSPVLGNTPLVRVPLLPATEVHAILCQTQLDKQRLAELSQAEQTAIDHEFLMQLESQVATVASRDLLVTAEYLNLRDEASPVTVAEFATARQQDAAALERWLKFLNQEPAITALSRLVAEKDPGSRTRQSEDIANRLALVRAKRSEQAAQNAAVQFRADDPRITFDTAGQVAVWPDRAALAEDALPPSGLHGPKLTTQLIHGYNLPVLRFDGEAVLQSERLVPSLGSLFVVFRPAADIPSGARIIGWEDAAVGQHGIGLMPDAAGGVHAILRRSGANGDIVAPPPARNEFQLISLTWDARGSTLYRNGELIGTNKSIDAVSSDPAIAALRIGEAGSGGGPRFRGDLCELRVYVGTIADATRVRVEDELRNRWFKVVPVYETSAEPLSPMIPDSVKPSSSTVPQLSINPRSTTEDNGSTIDNGFTIIEDLYNELLSPRSPYWVHAADRLNSLSLEARNRLVARREELELLKKKPAAEIPQAVVVQDGGPVGTKHEGFQDAVVYLRGNPATPGKQVPRGVPGMLAGSDSTPITTPPITSGSGRRELAQWLTHPSNPLTARVLVNRLWQHHFGEGLVRTSTNFGLRGERPSHPELLDHLARRFIDSGWSIKAIQREILLSSVYQQSSQASAATPAADPENRWLARMPRRRLESEAIRDSLLAVSGQLDRSAGGPGFLDAKMPQRTLYLMSTRTGSKTADFNSLFDGPAGGGIIERRTQSIVAPQALYLLNDSLLDDVSAALARRVSREVDSGRLEERITRLYELALARPPSAAEIEIGRQLFSDPNVGDAWTRYCRVILCTNEFIYVD